MFQIEQRQLVIGLEKTTYNGTNVPMLRDKIQSMKPLLKMIQ